MRNSQFLLWMLIPVMTSVSQAPPPAIVWNLEQSPVVLTGSFTVPDSMTLIIEAGVEVRMDPGVVLTVEGGMVANGREENPIRFVPNGNNRWGALVILGNTFCELRHCHFERGDSAGGDRIGLVNVMEHSAGVVMKDCHFADWPDSFGRKAIQMVDSSTVEIRNCYFGPGANEAVLGVCSPVWV